MMRPDEWTRIVERIQGAYQREVPPETAAAWYEELKSFSGEEVLDAARRVIRQHYKFTVAAAYQAIDANDKEAREARERYDSGVRQRTLEGKRGVPAPPEFRKALQVFGDASSWSDGRMRPEARDEIHELAGRIERRGPQWVADDPELVEPEELRPRDPSGAVP